jgi:hypothetical protein
MHQEILGSIFFPKNVWGGGSAGGFISRFWCSYQVANDALNVFLKLFVITPNFIPYPLLKLYYGKAM